MATHVAVWIDHTEARIFDVHPDSLGHHHHADETTVKAPNHRVHRHQRGHDGEGHEHSADALHFFTEIARHLAGAGEVLIIGPAAAKRELMAHLNAHQPGLAAVVIGVETVDHPSDGEIVALAATRFLQHRALK